MFALKLFALCGRRSLCTERGQAKQSKISLFMHQPIERQSSSTLIENFLLLFRIRRTIPRYFSTTFKMLHSHPNLHTLIWHRASNSQVAFVQEHQYGQHRISTEPAPDRRGLCKSGPMERRIPRTTYRAGRRATATFIFQPPCLTALVKQEIMAHTR